MNKIKLNVRQLDGVTLVEQAPEFQLVNGWTQATLPAAAGVLPAGLWGKVPGGDPYLLHVSVLTTGPLAVGLDDLRLLPDREDRQVVGATLGPAISAPSNAVTARRSTRRS